MPHQLYGAGGVDFTTVSGAPVEVIDLGAGMFLSTWAWGGPLFFGSGESYGLLFEANADASVFTPHYPQVRFEFRTPVLVGPAMADPTGTVILIANFINPIFGSSDIYRFDRSGATLTLGPNRAVTGSGVLGSPYLNFGGGWTVPYTGTTGFLLPAAHYQTPYTAPGAGSPTVYGPGAKDWQLITMGPTSIDPPGPPLQYAPDGLMYQPLSVQAIGGSFSEPLYLVIGKKYTYEAGFMTAGTATNHYIGDYVQILRFDGSNLFVGEDVDLPHGAGSARVMPDGRILILSADPDPAATTSYWAQWMTTSDLTITLGQSNRFGLPMRASIGAGGVAWAVQTDGDGFMLTVAADVAGFGSPGSFFGMRRLRCHSDDFVADAGDPWSVSGGAFGPMWIHESGDGQSVMSVTAGGASGIAKTVVGDFAVKPLPYRGSAAATGGPGFTLAAGEQHVEPIGVPMITVPGGAASLAAGSSPAVSHDTAALFVGPDGWAYSIVRGVLIKDADPSHNTPPGTYVTAPVNDAVWLDAYLQTGFAPDASQATDLFSWAIAVQENTDWFEYKQTYNPNPGFIEGLGGSPRPGAAGALARDGGLFYLAEDSGDLLEFDFSEVDGTLHDRIGGSTQLFIEGQPADPRQWSPATYRCASGAFDGSRVYFAAADIGANEGMWEWVPSGPFNKLFTTASVDAQLPAGLRMGHITGVADVFDPPPDMPYNVHILAGVYGGGADRSGGLQGSHPEWPNYVPGMYASPTGQFGPRPVFHNPGGSISTVRTISFSEGGKEVLIPTVQWGPPPYIASDADSIAIYHGGGGHFGTFNTVGAADAFAENLHLAQDWAYQDRSGADVVLAGLHGSLVTVTHGGTVVHAVSTGLTTCNGMKRATANLVWVWGTIGSTNVIRMVDSATGGIAFHVVAPVHVNALWVDLLNNIVVPQSGIGVVAVSANKPRYLALRSPRSEG